MKKILAIVLCIALAAAALSGCKNGREEIESNDKIKIAATIFPEYDWVREILGGKAESAELTLLLDNGVDLHSYQPTAEDIIKIKECDMFIYVGGESDKWAVDVLGGEDNENMSVISLLDVLGSSVKEEEVVEGMEEDDEEEGEETEYDEHVWLSLRNAQTIVSYIAKALGEIDAENKDFYLANANAYNKKLSALDYKYTAAAANAQKNTILFGDRFPFRYMADDYGLSYYAAFTGCSAETEASFETIVFLANKADEMGLDVILKLESSDGKIAQTINQNTASENLTILTMNSMQSTTLADVDNGASYLGIMEDNLEALEQAIK